MVPRIPHAETALPASIKQWVTAQDGFENLHETTAPMPVAGPGEVLVKINAVSINYRDTKVIRGQYIKPGEKSGSPIVPCADMCGTIVRVGPACERWMRGDRCLSIFNQTHLKGQVTAQDMKSGLGYPLPGVLCEYRVFPEHGLVKTPSYLSDEEACTLPIAALTAWMAFHWMTPVEQPESLVDRVVLIQGTGGVSINGLLIAKASGAKVIITSSSDDKLQKAHHLGADHLINYRTTPTWDETVLSLTAQQGADIIFENGGAQTLRRSFNCVALGGLIACIGYLSGKEEDENSRTNTNFLALRKNVTLKGLLNGPADRFEEMIAFYEKHRIRPVVDRVFEFADAGLALAYLWDGKHFGKVVIRVAA